MKELLIGFFLTLCLLLAGCVQSNDTEPESDYFGDGSEGANGTSNGNGDDNHTLITESPPEDEGNESGGDDNGDTPDEGNDGNEDAAEGDDDEPAEQPDSDGDDVPDDEDQCPGEDDRVDDDASGEPDCTENQT
jgi:hypothetical protein